MKGRVKREIPEETRQPARFPHAKIWEVLVRGVLYAAGGNEGRLEACVWQPGPGPTLAPESLGVATGRSGLAALDNDAVSAKPLAQHLGRPASSTALRRRKNTPGLCPLRSPRVIAADNTRPEGPLPHNTLHPRFSGLGARNCHQQRNPNRATSHHGDPRPGRSGFRQVGNVTDDAAGRRFFSAGLPFPPTFYSGAAQFSPRFTLIDSQDLVVKSRPNSFDSTLIIGHLPKLTDV
ncbi:hypothetical protein PR048_012252 [Dryococelus australis]|uniref:Uncharacterized protein n=1 Tax=Dryococelus australis TaxID=614101 RepID=A0ABQ9HP04_9NEOP|nr:hypothetical protein PR048_012252 [Dryococelus australis]